MTLRANQASDALIQYEAAQELVAMQVMTDSGDAQTFTVADAPWSNAPGAEPTILPNGVATGGEVTPLVGQDNQVEIADITYYRAGVLRSLDSILAQTIARGTAAYIITSIAIDSSDAIEILPGDDDSVGFSAARGAPGGPPWIPTDSIEIAQVRYSSSGDAEVAASEIRQIAGNSLERYDHPVWSEDFGRGEIKFISALPLTHSDDDGGNVDPKLVFCEIYTPTFADLEPASDFVPPEITHSQTSTEVYGGAIGASSSSLGQGSFTVYLRDGVTDPLIDKKNQELWFRFYPHRLRTPHLLAQGTLGISRTFPAGDSIQAACTLSAMGPAIEVSE